ncbi:MAG: transglycosylase SLT domain-containing protein [Dissulfurispiraceae bacterium]
MLIPFRKSFWPLLFVIFLVLKAVIATAETASDSSSLLVKGKASLDMGDYQNAVPLLSNAYAEVPVLGDYALLWRAEAFAGAGETDKALNDLKTLIRKYPDSSLMKGVRRKEIEICASRNDPILGTLFHNFIRDYPSDTDTKYLYAKYLKANNDVEQAKKIFKEIFISVSPFSMSAFNELQESDITTQDLIKRAKNLNNAWLFKEAEQLFMEALKTGDRTFRDQVLDGLAYSLFRQKRYKEAAEIYKEINDYYWRARSILRSGDIKTFEKELPTVIRFSDIRIAPLLITYGTKKRRGGNVGEAFSIFRNLLSRYPSEREESLWAIGWTYYILRDYKDALDIFSQLSNAYSNYKYRYWKIKCAEMLGKTEEVRASDAKELRYRDFYGFLVVLKDNKNLLPTGRNSLETRPHVTAPSERINLLLKFGFKAEAIAELTYLSKKPSDLKDLISICTYLEELGEYKTSVNLMSKVPYSEDLHDLLYPLGDWSAVREASQNNSIDPLLLLSVIREESRFDSQARSIAGAIGLMQLMPKTALKYNHLLNVNSTDGSYLLNARTNILIGSNYLSSLLRSFQSIPMALAAYNAGEDAVREWIKKSRCTTVDEFIEDIPYDETRNYVKRVLTTYFEYIRASDAGDISRARKYIGNL